MKLCFKQWLPQYRIYSNIIFFAIENTQKYKILNYMYTNCKCTTVYVNCNHYYSSLLLMLHYMFY